MMWWSMQQILKFSLVLNVKNCRDYRVEQFIVILKWLISHEKMTTMDYKIHIRGSINTALIVGSILTLINHPQEIFNWDFELREAMRWSLNYVVPFTVSFYSRLASERKIKKAQSQLIE